MKTDLIEYSDFSLYNIQADSFEEIPIADERYLYRIEIPSNSLNPAEMEKRGFILVDRTIGVSVALKKSNIDYQKMIRFEIAKGDHNIENVRNIALSSFQEDRRFNVRSIPDEKVSTAIINRWVDQLSEIFICMHKDNPVGFLDIEQYGENECFIHLAAVLERYRAAGAAVSMYAFSMLDAKEKGYNKIHGRISSGNTAVMNLYSMLGGSFANPKDIFIRKEL